MLKNLNPLRFIRRAVYRAKQFVLALTLRLTDEDRAFIAAHLRIPEASLFKLMPEDEQKHSVMIAKKMLAAAHGSALKYDEAILAKIGLLHDVGKSAAKMSIIDRSVLVIGRRLCPPLYQRLASAGREPSARSFARKAYVHKEHASIGAEALRKAKTEERVVNIINAHDLPASGGDPVELMFLKKIDNEN